MQQSLIRLLITSYISSCLSLVTAQDNEEPSRRSAKTMRVIAVSNRPDTELGKLYYENRGKKVQLYIPFGTLSHDQAMPKGDTLEIYQEIETQVPDSEQIKTSYKNVGSIPLTSGSKSIVILSVPPDFKKHKIKGRSFKDSPTEHPRETARIFNMSPQTVAVSANKKSVRVTSGEDGKINWKAVAFNSVAFKIGMEKKKKGTWKIIESTECVAPPDTRTFIFVVSAEYEGQKTITTMTCLDPVFDTESN